MTTGSGLGRFVGCRASSVLPKVWPASDVYSTAGQAKHSYLERISGGMAPDESLALVEQEHREVCAELDLGQLEHDLKLAAEVTLVYHPPTDTARVLGQGLARDYRGVADDEVAMTLDLTGVDAHRRRGTVKDYKGGWLHVTATPDNWQIKGGCLALARVHDLHEVDGELVFIRPGQDVRRDRATFTAFDLLAAAAELREVHARAVTDRAAYARGEHVEPTEGPWCRYCPSAWACPAKTGLIRAALAGELVAPPTPADAARLRPRLKEAIKLLAAVDAQIVARAAVEPILVERTDDGAEVWLGEVIGEGNRKIDAKIGIPIAAAELKVAPEDAAAFIEQVAKLEVTQTKLEDAIKARVPRGHGAATMRRVLKAIEDAGGVTRPVTRSVELHTLPARTAR